MKTYKKLLLILAGSVLALPAFFVTGNKNHVTETKAADALAYSTTFSGATVGSNSFNDGYAWTFNEYINRVGEGGGIGFNLTKYTTSCTMTFKNAFATNPIKVTKIEIEVSSNPYDYEATNSASVYPSQGSSGTTKTITENEVKTTISQTFSGTSTSNVTIKLNNLYAGPNTIWVYSVKLYEAQTSTMTITAGEGVSSVYLSDNENALSGSASGSKFEVGKTIYGFAVLEDGYEHAPGWVKVSSGDEDVEGAKYRVGSYMNAGLDHDFGTQNAIEKQTSQVVYFYDYFGNPLTDVSSHEFSIGDGAYELPDPGLDEYHTFIGWNSSFDYQGTTYNQTLSAEEVDQIASGEASVTELFVMAQLVEKLQAFLTKVESLPTDVELSDEYETILKEAYEIYSGFTAEEAAVQEVADYEDSLEICWQDYVTLAIDSIGDPADSTFEDNLERAERIYDECPDEYKEGIDISALQSAQVNYVKYLIDNIGEVALTDECKAKLDKVREAYEALGSQEQKDAVTNLNILVAKEAEYAALLNQQKADEVIALINAIGEVTLEKESKITDARAAYQALSEEQKALVLNYKDLTDAEARLVELKQAYADAQEVKALINAIGEVKYPESGDEIGAAREAYEALTSDDQRMFVDNYETLTDAETEYNNQKMGGVEVVENLIEAIGEVTLEKENQINSAKTAFDALTEEQKALVENKQVLDDAIAELALLKHQDEVKDNGVQVTGKDGELIPVNVTLKVELKTEVKAEQGSTEYSKISSMLGENEKISAVFDVKLIKTEGSVQTEIQPSDIKEGMIIIIEITLPDGLNVEGLRILHIHSEEDIAFVNNFTINGNKLVFEADRLSEIAFVTYHPFNSKTGAGLPGWAIALIVIGALLVTCCLAFFLLFFVFNKWIIVGDKVVRAFRIGGNQNEIKLLTLKFSKETRIKDKVFSKKKDALEELKRSK